MEANRRNAEDGITLRMSQASNKDMASGETGSMVQDEGGWWVVATSLHSSPASLRRHSLVDHSMDNPHHPTPVELSAPIRQREPAGGSSGTLADWIHFLD